MQEIENINQEPDSNIVDDDNVGELETKGKQVRPRWFRLQFGLGLLLLSFIPAAYFAQIAYDQYAEVFLYTESPEEYLAGEHELTTIDFESKPDGTPIEGKAPVNSMYLDLGVSFAACDSNWNGLKSPKVDWTKLNWNPSTTKDESNTPVVDGDYVGVSNYAFRFPELTCKNSVAAFISQGSFFRRFKERIIIRFHEPGELDKPRGVYRFGFYAARLHVSETLTARLYGSDGELIAESANKKNICTLMAFKTRKPVYFVEILATGSDTDYAITHVSFSAAK